MAEETVERVVLVDTYAWMTPWVGGPPGRGQHNVATRGETISVTPAEARRGEALLALGTAAQADVAAAMSGSAPAWDDVQLRSATVDEVLAYLSARPGDASRVLDIENARPRPRVTLVAAVEQLMEAHAAAVEDADARAELDRQADAEEAAERQRVAADAAARAAAGGAPVVGSGAAPLIR